MKILGKCRAITGPVTKWVTVYVIRAGMVNPVTIYVSESRTSSATELIRI